jgi:hypothetical protein
VQFCIDLPSPKKGGYKKFKGGLCHHCGKQGHKKLECQQLKNENEEERNNISENNGAFKGTCFICGKKGHRASECRQHKGGDSNNNNNQGYVTNDSESHFVRYMEEATLCMKFNEKSSVCENEYDKLGSFFDSFGGEDANSLDESESVVA